MKKLNLVLLSSVMLLAACGEESVKPAPAEQENTAPTENVEESESTEIEEQTVEIEPVEINVEVVEEVTYAFTESATGINWASYYAELKNNSNVPVNVSSSSVVYTDESGENIIMVSDMGLSVHPRAILPGETAFVSIYDPIQDTEPFSGPYQANIEINAVEATETAIVHETENVNVIFRENGEFSNIHATGKINVTEDQEIMGYSVVVAMYDENGEFLGSLDGGSDEEIISQGKSFSFDIENPPFPSQLMEEVTEWKAIAYSNGL